MHVCSGWGDFEMNRQCWLYILKLFMVVDCGAVLSKSQHLADDHDSVDLIQKFVI